MPPYLKFMRRDGEIENIDLGDYLNTISATQLEIQEGAGTPSTLIYNAAQKRLELTLGKYFSYLTRTGSTEFSAWGDGGYATRMAIDIRDYIAPMGWHINTNGYLSIYDTLGGNIDLTYVHGLIDYAYTQIYGTGLHAKLFMKWVGQENPLVLDLPWHLNFVQTRPSQPEDPFFPTDMRLDKETDDGFLRLVYPYFMPAEIRNFSEIPGRIQVRYANSTGWNNLVDVPPPAAQTPIEPIPGASDEADAVCLAAMNAARAIGATYEEIETRVAANLFDNPLAFAQWMLNTSVGVLTGNVSQGILSDVLLTLSFLFMQGDITTLPWKPSLEDKMRCILIANATANTDLEVGFDHAGVVADVASLIPVDDAWNFVSFIVQWLNEDALNTAGKVAYFTTPACSSC